MQPDQYANLLSILNLIVEPLTETIGHLIFNAIRYQHRDIPRPIENGRAMGADFEVGLNPCAQFSIDLAIHIIGDLSPDLFTADFNHFHAMHPVPLCFKLSASQLLPRPHLFIFRFARTPATVDARS
jgi:hypothetical protein